MGINIDILHQFQQRQWITFVWAIVVAAVLNCGLFTLMPSLINRDTDEPMVAALIPQVNLVRLPDKIVTQKVKPPPSKEPKVVSKPEPFFKPQPKTVPELSLAFAINPQLPVKPSALRLPPLKTALALSPVVGDVFSVDDLDAPLTILARTPPLYPLRARQRGIEGWVRVKMQVDELGNVTEVSILEARPEGVFEKSVRHCVRGWRFRPGTIEGVAVKAEVETTVEFELE